MGFALFPPLMLLVSLFGVAIIAYLNQVRTLDQLESRSKMRAEQANRGTPAKRR
ncbi:MAG: hypothetical protein AAGA12_13880 [Pseudomonadota bacterium]